MNPVDLNVREVTRQKPLISSEQILTQEEN